MIFYLFIIHVWSCPSSRFSWTFYCLQDKALTTWCGVKVHQYLTYLFNLMFYHSPPFTTLAILQIYYALLLIRLFTCDVSSIKDTFFPSLCTVKFYSSFKTLLRWALCCEVLCDLSRKHFSLLCYYSSFVIAFTTVVYMLVSTTRLGNPRKLLFELQHLAWCMTYRRYSMYNWWMNVI